MSIDVNYNKLLFILFVITPLVDSINGILLRAKIHTIFSFGQVYRCIVLMLMIFFLFKNRKNIKRDAYAFIMIFYLFILDSFHFFYHKSLLLLKNDYIVLSKFIYIVIIVECFKVLYYNKSIDKKIISKIIYWLGIITPLTIIIPYLFGVGQSTYKNGGGYKAFYNANNDLSIVIIILFVYFLYRVLFIRENKFLDFLAFLLICFSNFLLGSKTNLILPFIITISFVFKVINDNRDSKIVKKRIVYVSVLAILVFIGFILSSNTIQKSIERFAYFLDNSNLVTFIFSSRNVMLKQAINNLMSEKNFIIKLLFGTGFGYRGEYWSTGNIIEMDIFDIMICYGITGFMFIYFYVLNIFIGLKNKFNTENFIDSTAYMVLLFFSTFAGHVMFSALAGTIFALVVSKIIIKEDYSSRLNL